MTFTGAAASCPDWPGCFANDPFPGFSGASALEFLHRIAALILTLLTLGVFLTACFRSEVRHGLRNLSGAAFLLVVAQALLGGAIIESGEATDVVIAHLGLAVLLFGVLLVLAFLVNFPFLPARWQKALLGALSPVGPAREEVPRSRPPSPRSSEEVDPADTTARAPRSSGGG